MKSISLFLNVILILLVLYLGCKDKFSCNGDKPVATSAYCPEKGCETYNPSEKYGMISFRTAQMLAQNYAQSEGKKFIYDGSLKTNEQDALSIWFDLKILKNFIAFIESSACKSNCDSTKNLGVRIYYGKYPDSSILHSFADLKDVPSKYGNHHTVFMMPTFYDPTSRKNFDFDPMQKTENCRFKPFDNAYTTSVYGVNIVSAANKISASKDSLAMIGKVRQQQGKPQDPKTFFVFGAAVHTMSAPSGSPTPPGDQQNHGDIMPPPDGNGSFPTGPTEN